MNQYLVDSNKIPLFPNSDGIAITGVKEGSFNPERYSLLRDDQLQCLTWITEPFQANAKSHSGPPYPVRDS